MRAKSIPADEQYRLVLECRASGMTDYQWCTEHCIKPGTFYNWIKRLRKNGCADIPAPSRKTARPAVQEVVQVRFDAPKAGIAEELPPVIGDIPFSPVPLIQCAATQATAAMELSVGQDTLRIPNGTDPVLLGQVIRLLKGYPC